MRIIILCFVLVVILAVAVNANPFFGYYDNSVFTASPIFSVLSNQGLSFFFLPYAELINGVKGSSSIIDEYSAGRNILNVVKVDFDGNPLVGPVEVIDKNGGNIIESGVVMDYFDDDLLVNELDQEYYLENGNSLDQEGEPEVVYVESLLQPVEVIVNKLGFEPSTVVVGVNQPVIWINKREKHQVLLMGLREISLMNSGLFESEDTFTWTFSESGNYTYADGIIIGVTGMIVVQ
jgi:plastocyanin